MSDSVKCRSFSCVAGARLLSFVTYEDTYIIRQFCFSGIRTVYIIRKKLPRLNDLLYGWISGEVGDQFSSYMYN